MVAATARNAARTPGSNCVPGSRFDFRKGFFGRIRRAVRARAQQGAIRVGDGQNARAERNRFAAQAVGIAAAVPMFRMVAHKRHNRPGKRNRRDNSRAQNRMRAEFFLLFGRQRPGFMQNVFGNAQPSDVVQQAGGAQRGGLFLAQVQDAGHAQSALLYAVQMSHAVRIAGFKRIGQGFNGGKTQMTFMRAIGLRLRGEFARVSALRPAAMPVCPAMLAAMPPATSSPECIHEFINTSMFALRSRY